MKLGIMQPYFFPYIGYYQLMAAVDEWVIFDDIQFINKGWVNRNRILHPDKSKEFQYITLPIEKHKREDKICDINVKSATDWRAQILGKFSSYKRKALYFDETIAFFEDSMATEETNLSTVLSNSIIRTAQYLGIDTKIHIQSQMGLELGPIEHAGQWALRISEVMGASEYINPAGGMSIFKPEEFEAKGITLTFMKPVLHEYVQRRGGFVPGLSILDVLMWNSVERTKEMIYDS